MTEPDPSAIASKFKDLVRPKTLAAFGRQAGSRNLKAALPVAEVTELTNSTVTVALTANPQITGMLKFGVSDEVKAKQAHYKLLFEVELKGARLKIDQGQHLLNTIEKLSGFEFVQVTSTGKRATSLRGPLLEAVQQAIARETEGARLAGTVALATKDERFAEYDEFVAAGHDALTEFSSLMTQVVAFFEDLIEFESIKAWVVKNPDTAQKQLEGALYVVDQGLNGVETAAGIAGAVPNPWTSGICEGIKITIRGLKICMAFVKKGLISRDRERQVEKYKQAHMAGEDRAEHEKDPTLMANMIAEKKKANTEIILVACDQLVATVGDVAIGLDTAWGVIRAAIAQAIEEYHDKRIALLKQQLGMPEEQKAGFLEELGKTAWDEFKDNVFSILEPLNLVKSIAGKYLGKKVAALVMEYMPVDPAQGVNGAALLGAMSDLEDTFLTGTDFKATDGEPKAPPPTYKAPTVDKQGNPIEAILGKGIEMDGERQYQFVRIAGQTGALYLDDLEFKADGAPEMNPVDGMLLQFLPPNDHLGRSISQVDLDKGFTMPTKAPPGATFTGNAMWVRIDDVWGYIDTKPPFTFFAQEVEHSAFADWSDRVLVNDGYKVGGETVAGTWYKPWPDKDRYLFVGAKGREWATAATKTANSPGQKGWIGTQIEGKAKVGYDKL